MKTDEEADDLVVYCADVGSIPLGRFGWARQEVATSGAQTGEDIRELAAAVATDLNEGAKVCLGFECPLFVPLRDEPLLLTRARAGEGAHPWSAGAGAGSLTVGLPQYVWVLREVRSRLRASASAYLEWTEFTRARTGLFLWEAFVTGEAKVQREGIGAHAADAVSAVRSFLGALPDVHEADAMEEREPVLSLIGAALLRSGWSDDPARLVQPCLVIRA